MWLTLALAALAGGACYGATHGGPGNCRPLSGARAHRLDGDAHAGEAGGGAEGAVRAKRGRSGAPDLEAAAAAGRPGAAQPRAEASRAVGVPGGTADPPGADGVEGGHLEGGSGVGAAGGGGAHPRDSASLAAEQQPPSPEADATLDGSGAAAGAARAPGGGAQPML